MYRVYKANNFIIQSSLEILLKQYNINTLFAFYLHDM